MRYVTTSTYIQGLTSVLQAFTLSSNKCLQSERRNERSPIKFTVVFRSCPKRCEKLVLLDDPNGALIYDTLARSSQICLVAPIIAGQNEEGMFDLDLCPPEPSPKRPFTMKEYARVLPPPPSFPPVPNQALSSTHLPLVLPPERSRSDSVEEWLRNRWTCRLPYEAFNSTDL
jgi:hypothetical protein